MNEHMQNHTKHLGLYLRKFRLAPMTGAAAGALTGPDATVSTSSALRRSEESSSSSSPSPLFFFFRVGEYVLSFAAWVGAPV